MKTKIFKAKSLTADLYKDTWTFKVENMAVSGGDFIIMDAETYSASLHLLKATLDILKEKNTSQSTIALFEEAISEWESPLKTDKQK